MGALNTEQLDALALAMSKIKFSPSGASIDEFVFDVKRRGDTLTFVHDGINVIVGGFTIVDFEHWADEQYPAVENRIIRYLYSADVQFSVGDVKNKAHVVLGYWKDTEKLLAPLGRSREADLIDTLLSKIDKVAGVIIPIEF